MLVAGVDQALIWFFLVLTTHKLCIIHHLYVCLFVLWLNKVQFNSILVAGVNQELLIDVVAILGLLDIFCASGASDLCFYFHHSGTLFARTFHCSYEGWELIKTQSCIQYTLHALQARVEINLYFTLTLSFIEENKINIGTGIIPSSSLDSIGTGRWNNIIF